MPIKMDTGIGILFIKITGIHILDSIVAIVVGLLIIKEAVDRVDAQSHSKSFLPSPMTMCWPELSTSGSVSHTQDRDAGCFSFRWTSVSLLGWHFPGGAKRIINLSPCYFSAPAKGMTLAYKSAQYRVRNSRRDPVRRKITT